MRFAPLPIITVPGHPFRRPRSVSGTAPLYSRLAALRRLSCWTMQHPRRSQGFLREEVCHSQHPLRSAGLGRAPDLRRAPGVDQCSCDLLWSRHTPPTWTRVDGARDAIAA